MLIFQFLPSGSPRKTWSATVRAGGWSPPFGPVTRIQASAEESSSRKPREPGLCSGKSRKRKDFFVLSWRWKVSNVVRSAIETKGSIDAAARAWSWKSLGTLWERTSGMKIEYIWANRLPGKKLDHPEKEHQVIVLSPETRSGNGLMSQRNIERITKIFLGRPASLLAIESKQIPTTAMKWSPPIFRAHLRKR
jgi:hypothetical protein